MRFLLDTNVVSELRHPMGDEAVKRRFAQLDPDSRFLSSIAFGELTRGVLRLPEGNRRSELLAWLERFKTEYGGRILPFDRETAGIWGKLVADSEAEGARLGVSDGQIAATGIQHGLAVITRNTRHFEITGVRLWNIWNSEWPD